MCPPAAAAAAAPAPAPQAKFEPLCRLMKDILGDKVEKVRLPCPAGREPLFLSQLAVTLAALLPRLSPALLVGTRLLASPSPPPHPPRASPSPPAPRRWWWASALWTRRACW